MPATLTTESLQEYADNRGVKPASVDRVAGVIKGCKILGRESANLRDYPESTLLAAKPLYEGAKVNVNHSRSPSDPRDYQDRIGSIRNVEHRADGLYGDFHFNPKHALAEQLCWDAEHSPENLGFSHNVEAQTSTNNGRKTVESITRVASVDLVADPATTKSLFESKGQSVPKTIKQIRESLKAGSLYRRLLEEVGGDGAAAIEVAPGATPDEESEKALMSMVTALIRNRELDDDTKVSRFKILLGLQKPPEPKPADGEEKVATESLRRQNATLTEQVEQFKTEKAVDALLVESKLPDRLKTATFKRQLVEAKTDQARRDLIEDRRILVTESAGYGPPVSREQVLEGEQSAETNGTKQGQAYRDQLLAQRGIKV